MVLAALALIALQVFLDLALPDYMAEITELVETKGSDMHEIWKTGAKMLVTALGSLLTSVVTVLLASRVAASLSTNLRMRLFKRVCALSGKEIHRFGTASLITRTTNDVMQLRLAVVLGLEVMVKAPVMAVWAIFKISGPAWTLTTAVGVGLLLSLTLICMLRCMPAFRRMQSYADDLGRITKENLLGLHTIRALDGERFEEERFERVNEALTQTHLTTVRTLSVLSPGLQLISNLLTIAVYFVGVLMINAAAPGLRVGIFSDTVAFLSYMLRIVTAFLLFAAASTLLPRAAISAGRIFEVLEYTPAIQSGSREQGEQELRGTVEFRNVSFFAEGAEEYVLRDISFRVECGETVGVIGHSGCGKSSLVALIARLEDASCGEVLVNGVNVRDYQLQALRAIVGHVPQTPFLFDGTLRDNITLGHTDKPFSQQLPEELLRVCLGEDILKKHADGIDMHVREGGVNLSKGEIQRIALARALWTRPQILVLDDTFSYFDAVTGERLRTSLARYRKELTRLIVTQRIASVRAADRIVVLDEGRVVDVGTHAQLMVRCGVYRDIARAQGEEVRDGEN